MKTSMQLKALVRNLSQKSNIEAEILLRNFMLERFLERIAVSEYKYSFILKGGMLISAMVGIDTRTTMDMDATIKGKTLTAPEITAIVEDIISIPIGDDVEFTMRGIEEIHEEADYPGFRVSLGAVLDKTKQTIKIDITTGDFVTPREIEYSFKLMFEDRKISIMAYNLETVLAEKFETVVTRSVTNTRMRDFYDIYILTTTQPFNNDTFRMALKNTVEKRSSIGPMVNMTDTIQTIAESRIMLDHWQRYQNKYSYAADISWDMAIGAVKDLADKSLGD